MIDRDARNEMLQAVQAFMDQKIGSDKFDDTIFAIASATQDETVQAMRDGLWFFYSDIEDHNIQVTKAEWDLMTRLRLVLSSDAEVEWYRTGPRWNVYRTIFASCLAGLGLIALFAGIGKVFILYWVLASLTTCAVLWIWNRNDQKAWAPNAAIYPFPSVASLLSIRRGTPHFAKQRYPKSLARKARLHRILDRAKLVVYLPLYILIGPFAMLILSLPIRQKEMRLKFPAQIPQREPAA